MWQKHTQVKHLNKGLELFELEVIIQPDPTLIRRLTKEKYEKTKLCLMKLTATTPAIQ